MARYALFTLVSLITVGALSQASPAQVTWQRITDNGAGFTISFPGRPAYSESTVPETGEPLESYEFYYNSHTLRIGFGPFTRAPMTAAEVNRLLGDIAGLYARGTGNLLRQEKLPDGGRQFDNLVKDASGTLHLRSRVYVRRGMVYTLSCGSYAPDGIDERIAEQFFSSFSFINVPPGRQVNSRRGAARKTPPKGIASNRWYTLRGPDGDFLAELPGKPDYSVATSSGAALHQYRFAHGENFFYISYREREEPGGSDERELKQALQRYHAGLPGWELLRQVEMPDGYLLEHRGMSTGYPILARTRLYLRGPRLYYVTVMTRNLSGPNKADVGRFFSSFRLL
jgi:hypothetical protein